MYFGGSNPKEILLVSLAITANVAIPCLTGSAYRGWARRWRNELSRWRSTLGLTSMVVTFLSWLAFVVVFSLMGLFKIPMKLDFLPGLELLLVFIGISLASTLKGTARMQSLAAGFLMVVVLFTTIVRF